MLLLTPHDSVEVNPHRKNAYPGDPSGLSVPLKLALLLASGFGRCVTNSGKGVPKLTMGPYE